MIQRPAKMAVLGSEVRTCGSEQERRQERRQRRQERRQRRQERRQQRQVPLSRVPAIHGAKRCPSRSRVVHEHPSGLVGNQADVGALGHKLG